MRAAIKCAVHEHSRCTRLGAHHPPSSSPPASPAGRAAGPRPLTENALGRRFRIQSFSDCRRETGCLCHISPKPLPPPPPPRRIQHAACTVTGMNTESTEPHADSGQILPENSQFSNSLDFKIIDEGLKEPILQII